MAVKIKVDKLIKIFGPTPKHALELLKNGTTKDEILKLTNHVVGVNNVSFEINKGETFVIMGLSGSGKSTLIRCLNLLNRPTEGQIHVDEENLTAYSQKELRKFRQNKTAMVFQHFGLFTHRTVIGNIEYGLEIRNIPKKERHDIALKTLKSVGLESFSSRFPGELSGGMQQRVGLARALATDPEILFMDEPFSALDPLIRNGMQKELIEIQEKLKKTIVFITHDINEAFKIGDRVAVMKDGSIEQIATPEEIISSPASDYIKEFIKDIDRSRVIKSKYIIFQPPIMIFLDDDINTIAGKIKSAGVSSCYVVDSDRKVKGIITSDDVDKAVVGKINIADILRDDYVMCKSNVTLSKLIPLAINSKYPVAVVDDKNQLLGLTDKKALLQGLMLPEN